MDAPKCPLCSKHVLKLVVQERLQQELQSKRAMLHDAEVVVVDKDYNILSVPCPIAPPSPPATPPGSPEGESRPNARAHTAHAPRTCGLVQHEQHEGVIRRVLRNDKQDWYGFVDAFATGITPEAGLYCNFPRFWKDRIMKCAPEDMRHDDAAVRSWLTGKRMIFSVKTKGMDTKTGNPRLVGIIHDLIDLESAAGSAQAAASGAQGGGMPHAPFDMAAGDANAGALRPPEDPRVPSAASLAPPKDPRRQAPQDPRVQRAPSDPRLLRQASASLVGGEMGGGGGAMAGTGDGLVSRVMAGGSAGKAVSLDARTDVVTHVQAAADASEEAAADKEAWLLLGGDYLCKMRVQVLQPNAHFPASAAGPGGSLLEQWLCSECPKIDLTQTICIQVLKRGVERGAGGLCRGVWRCACVCVHVCKRVVVGAAD